MKYIVALFVALGLFFSVSTSFAGTGSVDLDKVCSTSENKEDASLAEMLEGVTFEKDGKKFKIEDGKKVEIED